MPFDSSAVLLERHRSGEPTAFVTLVEGHQGELLRLARGLLGRGSAFEDVVQEAFMRLAQSPPVIPEAALGDVDVERAHLSSWLHTVTRNLCMDVIRSETRRKRRERSVAQPDHHTGGILEVEAGDTRQAVERSLERLPEDQREVLVLRLLAEKSYREISEITGKKVGTVGWLVSVGLKALCVELGPLLGGEPDLGMGLAQGELS
ncbi:MAG: RNA polymerase sigma factor [Planctomycetota bacterium]|nr:RNA polymerase sigma factor [Planctomycetota bacterium]